MSKTLTLTTQQLDMLVLATEERLQDERERLDYMATIKREHVTANMLSLQQQIVEQHEALLKALTEAQ